MNASPITSWEGAEAYFTFADNPAMMLLILAVSVAATAGAIVWSAVHEGRCYRDYE